jgi:hypothetical protein
VPDFFFTRSKVFLMIQSSAKVRYTDFGTRSKVFIMVFLALQTFDLVLKVGHTDVC